MFFRRSPCRFPEVSRVASTKRRWNGVLDESAGDWGFRNPLCGRFILHLQMLLPPLEAKIIYHCVD